MAASNQLKCNDSRPCFARRVGSDKCSVLQKNEKCMKVEYKNGKCPFCKPVREYTKGRKYVTNKNYVTI